MAGHSVTDARNEVARMDESTDFEALVENVRTHSSTAPGSDTERVSIRTLESVDEDGVTELVSALETEESVDRGDLAVFASPSNADRLLESVDAGDREALESTLGHPVRVEGGMSDDAILVVDPDAIEGEELVAPRAVALGTVGRAE